MSFTRQFLSLSMLMLLFCTIHSYDNETTLSVKKHTPAKQFTEAINFLAKFTTACSMALGAHYVLEYVSTYMHEYGHGIASRGDYAITMISNDNILEPWHGITHWKKGTGNPFFTTLAGPLAGISATYLQIITLKMLDGYMRNKSLRTSFYEGLKFPITFFINAVKMGKKYSSMMLSSRSIYLIKNKSFISFFIDGLLFLRMGRFVGESIYGLLPYHDPMVIGDGEKIWKTLFGKNFPLFTGNLAYITLAVIISPYIIGSVQAVYEKNTKKTICTD